MPRGAGLLVGGDGAFFRAAGWLAQLAGGIQWLQRQVVAPALAGVDNRVVGDGEEPAPEGLAVSWAK